jgi:hypothetical protein
VAGEVACREMLSAFGLPGEQVSPPMPKPDRLHERRS